MILPGEKYVSLGFDRRRWAGGQRRRLRFQPAHHLVDGAFELRVFAFNDRHRFVFDLDVRVDSVAFDHPFAFAIAIALSDLM